MIFNPFIRKQKYSVLREAIVRLGFHAETMVRETETGCGLAIWTGQDVSDLHRAQGRFWMYCRQRGWFLGFSGLRRYRIPNQCEALDIALELVTTLQDVQREEAFTRIVQKFSLVPVGAACLWHLDEREEQRLSSPLSRIERVLNLN